MARVKYYQALLRALHDEMARDETIVLLGEDVGPSGGIFAQTRGLYDAYGPDRVRDTPIAENGFMSVAVGAAMTGLRPVVEIGFEDFLTCCMDPLVNQAAKLRYMLGGQVTVPLTVYTFGSGGVNAGPQHSQSFAAWFAQIPGLQVIAPSTPRDVFGLLKSAIRDDNPVLCLLAKCLVGSAGELGEIGTDFTLPLGRADIKRPGDDVTLVAISTMVRVALAAAEALAAEGIEAEVIDPMTISPLDDATIVDSVKRTGRLCIVHEAHAPCGIGAEIIARVSEQAHGVLQAAPIRITPPFTPTPFAPVLEKAYLPSPERVVTEIKALMG
jgi:acetoin:2,6-dichlorophenolindophenol oxidoreductase subunit beta